MSYRGMQHEFCYIDCIKLILRSKPQLPWLRRLQIWAGWGTLLWRPVEYWRRRETITSRSWRAKLVGRALAFPDGWEIWRSTRKCLIASEHRGQWWVELWWGFSRNLCRLLCLRNCCATGSRKEHLEHHNRSSLGCGAILWSRLTRLGHSSRNHSSEFIPQIWVCLSTATQYLKLVGLSNNLEKIPWWKDGSIENARLRCTKSYPQTFSMDECWRTYTSSVPWIHGTFFG